MRADIKIDFDFSPDFARVRSAAHIIATHGLFLKDGDTVTERPNTDMRLLFLETLALCCAWPIYGGGMGRAEVLTYFERAAFHGKRKLRTVTGAALFGPSKPEYGVKHCTQRSVTGILVEPDMALHPHADLRTWVMGQAGEPLELLGEKSDKGEPVRFKITPNAYRDKGLVYGLFAHQGTIRDATGAEVSEFLTAPEPLERPKVTFEVEDAERELRKIVTATGAVSVAAEAAPFWRWADAKIIGGVL